MSVSSTCPRFFPWCVIHHRAPHCFRVVYCRLSGCWQEPISLATLAYEGPSFSLLAEVARLFPYAVRLQIHELHSPAMRDRHWKDLLDVTEKHRPPAERRLSRVRSARNDPPNYL